MHGVAPEFDVSSNGNPNISASRDSLAFDLTNEQIADARLVLVDDDALVTSSLSSFLGLELEIDPVVFNKSTDAAQYLHDNEVDLIISDFLMPDMDGIQLLSKAREAQPNVPRILLTGYADKENAIKAINEVRVFQYVEKPWQNEWLRNVVINALERRVLVKTLTERLEELMQTRQDLSGLRNALVRTFA